jgi:hypothetical protein
MSVSTLKEYAGVSEKDGAVLLGEKNSILL